MLADGLEATQFMRLVIELLLETPDLSDGALPAYDPTAKHNSALASCTDHTQV